MSSKDGVFVDTLIDQSLDVVQIRMVISTLRALGYTSEMQYSAMNSKLSESSIVVRRDGAETIDLVRSASRRDPIPREY